MAYNDSLAQRIERYLRQNRIKHEAKRMMGGLCFMVNGKMCVGVEKDRLMARIGPDAYEEALKRNGCLPMDFTGRPLRGFVFVEPTGLGSDNDLASWLELALAFNPKATRSKSRSRPASNRRKTARRATSRNPVP